MIFQEKFLLAFQKLSVRFSLKQFLLFEFFGLNSNQEKLFHFLFFQG